MNKYMCNYMYNFMCMYIIYYNKKNMLIIVGKIDQCNVIHNLG